jgi:ferredoxin
MHPEKNHIVICDLCGGKPRCAEACREGRWKTLEVIPRNKKVSYKALAKSPDQLTHEVAEEVLGKEITKEVMDW